MVFHLLAWIAAWRAAADWPAFAGGLGWPLAALHLVTLGVLAMTAIGASLQLLPVATRQPIRRVRWPALVWWLYAPGVAALAARHGHRRAGAARCRRRRRRRGLLLYAWLLAANLLGARGMPGIVAHGWAALAALVVVLLTARRRSSPRTSACRSSIAAPPWRCTSRSRATASWACSPSDSPTCWCRCSRSRPAPDARLQLVSWGSAVIALCCAGAAALGVLPVALRVVAIGAGAIATGLHLALMRRALREGMRKDLGVSFALVRTGWTGLVVSLLAALGVALDAPVPGLPLLFGLLLVGVWLLSFVLGILQRILPFLASMHAAVGKHRPPTPSSFTRRPPLVLHFACHLSALAAMALAIVTASPLLAELAAAAGTIGALAYAAFFATLVRRLAAPARPSALPAKA